MKTLPPPSKPNGLLASVKRYPGVDLVYHVAYYRAARVGYQDIISRSLHDFKDGCEPQASRWISLAAPMVCKELSFDLIVRVLGSNEANPSGNAPLDRLCEAIAQGSGAIYEPARLHKEKAVSSLTTLGGRVLRQKELDGAYGFDGSGLGEKVRILLVDDLATTGATLEAVSKAIRQGHSGAEVICFVLARVDPQLQNTHIDPAYFLRGAPPESRQKTGRPVLQPPAETPEARRETTSTTRPTGTNGVFPATRSRTLSSLEVKPRGTRSLPALPVRRGLDTRVYVAGLILSVLLLGGTMLFPAKKEPGPPPTQFVQLVNSNAVKSPEPIPERRPPVASQMLEGKPALIMVPSTGLRISHSMESRTVPKTTVHQKERVEILRRYSSRTGPDWFQVRTKNGTVGWVIASVVKEVRG